MAVLSGTVTAQQSRHRGLDAAREPCRAGTGHIAQLVEGGGSDVVLAAPCGRLDEFGKGPFRWPDLQWVLRRGPGRLDRVRISTETVVEHRASGVDHVHAD